MDNMLAKAKRMDNREWVRGYYFAWHSRLHADKYIAYIHVVRMENGLKRLDEMIKVDPSTVKLVKEMKEDE